MKKYLVVLLLVFFTGCFNNEMSDEDFAKFVGTYYGSYVTEEKEEEFFITVNAKREFSSYLGDGEFSLDKNNELSGTIETDQGIVNYEGKMNVNGKIITGTGTWESENQQGTWQITKGEPQPSNIPDDQPKISGQYNQIIEELAEISDQDLAIIKNHQAVVPGGHFRDFVILNENVRGSPSDTIKSYRLKLVTSTSLEDSKGWLANEAEKLGWRLFDEHEFFDGSFNLHYLRDDSVREMIISGYWLDDHTNIFVIFDNR